MRLGHFTEYRGYIGSIEYDPEDKIYYGRLMNINDFVNYHTDYHTDEFRNLTNLEKQFHEAVDDYIEFKNECEKWI